MQCSFVAIVRALPALCGRKLGPWNRKALSRRAPSATAKPVFFALCPTHYFAESNLMSASEQPSFATCDICDAFEDDTSGDIRVLPPVFKDFGALKRFCGPVVTLRCLEDNSRVREAVNSTGYVDTPSGRVGRVLVVDGAGSMRRALVGGNLAAAAARNGWAGIVVDGAVRDIAELNQARVGIRALALMPMRTAKRGEGQGDLPVQIQGVWVHPGDWLYADEDGMVVSTRPVHG